MRSYQKVLDALSQQHPQLQRLLKGALNGEVHFTKLEHSLRLNLPFELYTELQPEISSQASKYQVSYTPTINNPDDGTINVDLQSQNDIDLGQFLSAMINSLKPDTPRPKGPAPVLPTPSINPSLRLKELQRTYIAFIKTLTVQVDNKKLTDPNNFVRKVRTWIRDKMPGTQMDEVRHLLDPTDTIFEAFDDRIKDAIYGADEPNLSYDWGNYRQHQQDAADTPRPKMF